MRIWGQLQKAALEILGADPAQGVQGRIWFNSASKQVSVDDGTTIQTLRYSAQGGVGPSPDWQPQGNAPLMQLDSAINKIYLFAQGQQQILYATLKVPSGYVAGRPISLLVDAYCHDNANNFLLASLSTLIRPGTDAFNATANQRASTTLITALGGGTVDKPQAVSLDLTDGSGQINGVAVQPNHVLQLTLFRQNSGTAPQSQIFADSALDVSVLSTMEVIF
jgi:hypothetical protein